MNIFAVDQDPVIAAQSLCDKHVVKMVLESTQLLCTAVRQFHQIGETVEYTDGYKRPLEFKTIKFYKETHLNHPCSIWARKCNGNYIWLWRHAFALSNEYTHRYGKKHACADLIMYCHNCCYYLYPNDGNDSITPFAQAMPEEYRREDAIEAYRLYYNEVKSKTIDCRWTKRNPPSWWKQQ